MFAFINLRSRSFLFAAILPALFSCANDAKTPEPPSIAAKAAGPKPKDVAATTVTAPGLEVTVPTFANATCPIMGKPISEKLYVETELGRIYVCCKACNEPILEDVGKAAQAAYPVIKRATNTVCPIMGDAIGRDSPTVTRQGIEIPVCCDECIAEVKMNDQIVLAKLANPTLIDLKNTVCPVTGEPIAANTFCVIGNHLVHLSATECIDRVKKDPAGVLEKAKSLAPSEKSGG